MVGNRSGILAVCVAGAMLLMGCDRSVDQKSVSRIAFGSCAFQWEPQPILSAVVAAEPDVYLSLGDAIYGDWDGEQTYAVTPETLKREWGVLAENPDWQHLVANVSNVDGTWDNHDYGHHSAGAEFALKEESKQIFLDFFGEPHDSERRRRAGLYDAKIHGPDGRRVQVILLDTRTFKSPAVLGDREPGRGGSLGKYAPHDDPSATLLGPAQWDWLKVQLRRPAEVRLICSSGQVVADQKGMDEWGNYPHERRRLFELITTTGASGAVLLSGNVHFAEISVTDEGPYPLYDFTSSGLTHIDEEYARISNPRRVAGPVADLNFGLVVIEWDSPGGTRLVMEIRDATGRVAVAHTVSLAELQAE